MHFEQYSTPLGRHFEVFAFRPAEQQFACLFLDVTDRRIGEEKLRALTETLEERVVERTAIAEQRAAQLRALAAQLTQAEERERQRVARVLHDQLQQLLVSARMKISVLCRRFQDPKLVETLGEVDQLIQQSIEESRSLTRELSPPVLYDGGLTAGLDWLARHMNRKHGLLVEVDASTETEPEESTRAFLFQAVRELLLNTVKHAGIDAASVELSFQENGRLRVVVSDDGVGFDAATLDICGDASRFGLFSLRERVELMGGSLRLETGPGQGTRVIVEVPALLDQGDVRASSEGQASRR